MHMSITETQQVSTNGNSVLRVVGEIGDQYIEAMSRVCDG